MRTFNEIDARRTEHGLSQKAVIEAAGINKETWRRIANGTSGGTVTTLRRLDAAVDALIAEGVDR